MGLLFGGRRDLLFRVHGYSPVGYPSVYREDRLVDPALHLWSELPSHLNVVKELPVLDP